MGFEFIVDMKYVLCTVETSNSGAGWFFGPKLLETLMVLVSFCSELVVHALYTSHQSSV